MVRNAKGHLSELVEFAMCSPTRSCGQSYVVFGKSELGPIRWEVGPPADCGSVGVR